MNVTRDFIRGARHAQQCRGKMKDQSEKYHKGYAAQLKMNKMNEVKS